MKLSLFFELPTPSPDDPTLEAKTFKNALEQIEIADQLGFHGIWEVEHHFLPGYSHSSCPEVFLAAASQRTKHLRLGHGIVHCPHGINHPIRIAERIASLDILSDGRVEFGGGRGTIPMELEGFGVDPEETRDQLVETLEMLPKMWTEETFQWSSPLMTIPPRHIVPKPVQKPHPPMWVAATQPWTVQFAAEKGLGLLGFGISDETKDDLLRLYKSTVKNAEPIGAFVNDKFAVMRVALCCDSDDEALKIQGPNFRLFYEQLESVNSTWRFGEAPRTYEYASERAKRRSSESHSIEDVVAGGGAVIGSVSTCQRILEGLAETGVDEAILFMQGATTPHETVIKSMKMLAEKVMPKIDC